MSRPPTDQAFSQIREKAIDHEAANAHRPCPWLSCLCTHVGCISGWIDKTDNDGDRAIPCPTCRPEVSAHFRRPRPIAILRRELPTLRRPSRHGSREGEW